MSEDEEGDRLVVMIVGALGARLRLVGVMAYAVCGIAVSAPVIGGVDGDLAALITRCAPTVNPITMAALVSAESRGHRYAIADAGPVNLPWSERKHLVRSFYLGSSEEAVAKAEELIAAGHTVSLGLAQVNDRNLRAAGLSMSTVFDPCANLAAGAKILTRFYRSAVKKFGVGVPALHAALSAYNSGDWERGAYDGFVRLVYQQVGRSLVLRSGAVKPLSADVRAVGSGIVSRTYVRGKNVGKAVKVHGVVGHVQSAREFIIID
jgi:type IV secretion system protein VirB1